MFWNTYLFQVHSYKVLRVLAWSAVIEFGRKGSAAQKSVINKIEGTPILKLAMVKRSMVRKNQNSKKNRRKNWSQKLVTKIRNQNSSPIIVT